jgi:hypothetical protein
MISAETKQRIDGMSYERMLELWRNAPNGHPLFQGEEGVYFAEEMSRKRVLVGEAEHVRVSKRIRWRGNA